MCRAQLESQKISPSCSTSCPVTLQPQFSQSVLYAQAQSVAFDQATHLASVTRPLIRAAENEATTMIDRKSVV